ncbi:uncharacterized protein METZ01_LOCUS84102 [marine metagenome]|uniref:Uncharacterized protein n=1 Tax=marine metagenome TaxID=408172 RepID=A0A381UUE4_9ZZZZ
MLALPPSMLSIIIGKLVIMPNQEYFIYLVKLFFYKKGGRNCRTLLSNNINPHPKKSSRHVAPCNQHIIFVASLMRTYKLKGN